MSTCLGSDRLDAPMSFAFDCTPESLSGALRIKLRSRITAAPAPAPSPLSSSAVSQKDFIAGTLGTPGPRGVAPIDSTPAGQGARDRTNRSTGTKARGALDGRKMVATATKQYCGRKTSATPSADAVTAAAVRAVATQRSRTSELVLQMDAEMFEYGISPSFGVAKRRRSDGDVSDDNYDDFEQTFRSSACYPRPPLPTGASSWRKQLPSSVATLPACADESLAVVNYTRGPLSTLYEQIATKHRDAFDDCHLGSPVSSTPSMQMSPLPLPPSLSLHGPAEALRSAWADSTARLQQRFHSEQGRFVICLREATARIDIAHAATLSALAISRASSNSPAAVTEQVSALHHNISSLHASSSSFVPFSSSSCAVPSPAAFVIAEALEKAEMTFASNVTALVNAYEGMQQEMLSRMQLEVRKQLLGRFRYARFSAPRRFLR
jgi:hypothetical protein